MKSILATLLFTVPMTHLHLSWTVRMALKLLPGGGAIGALSDISDIIASYQ